MTLYIIQIKKKKNDTLYKTLAILQIKAPLIFEESYCPSEKFYIVEYN